MTPQRRLESSPPPSTILEAVEADEAGPDGLDLWQLSFRYKWRLGLGAVIGLLLGFAAYWRYGPEYQATAKILVSKKASVPLTQEQATTFGERGEHIALILSPMIVGKAVQRGHLNALPSLAHEEHPAESILDDLRVKRIAGTDRSDLNVLDIAYRNPHAKDACAVVSAIIESYRDYLQTAQQAHNEEALTLITEASNDLLAQMRDREREYLEFRDQAPLHWRNPPGAENTPDNATNVHQERLLAIEAQRRDNILKRAEIKSKLDAIQRAVDGGQSPRSLQILIQRFLSVETGTGTAAANGTETSQLASLEAQLLPLLMEEQRLLSQFGKDHPDVKSVRKKIETIRDFYRNQGVMVPVESKAAKSASRSSEESADADLVSVAVQFLKQQLAELDNRDRELARIYEQEAALEKEFAHYAAKDRALNDDLQRIKHVWQLAVNRLNELNLLKDQGGYRLQQIAPVRAELQVKRVIQFLGGGTLAGLALVLGCVYLGELRNTTIRSSVEIRQRLSLPFLGSVPEFVIDQIDRGDTRHSGLNPGLCYCFRPGSAEAEAFRSIRTALLAGAARHDAKVIQVTSPETRDGKTTFVSNLAVAVAQSGRQVLLIDADLRHPAVHELFGLPRGPGISEVLAGEIDLPTAACELAIDGLSVLTAGECPRNPSERLSSPMLGGLLDEARRRFDVVLVDTPPLLPVSDACVVAGRVDALVLVLRIDKSGRTAVQRSAELLDTYGFRVLGAVANGTAETADLDNSYGNAALEDDTSEPEAAPKHDNIEQTEEPALT